MQISGIQVSMELADVCIGIEDCESCRFYKYCVDEATIEEAAA